jgi:RNA polymerase sigma-70 factor (ECF subfamily)
VSPDIIGGVPVPDLLAQIQIGNQETFNILCRELLPMLWRVANNATHGSDAAEDIVQDVFIWLWMQRQSIDINLDIRVYLVVAIRNRARNLSKRGRIMERIVRAIGTNTTPVPALSQPIPAADDTLETGEFQVAYRRALSLLTDRERMAVLLRWEEGWPFMRIGQALSLSDQGVRKLILRAQAKVRAELSAYESS